MPDIEPSEPKTALPFWINGPLTIFTTLQPQFAWLVPIVNVSYELIQKIPWPHKKTSAVMRLDSKSDALCALASAVAEACKCKSAKPVEELNDRLRALAESPVV